VEPYSLTALCSFAPIERDASVSGTLTRVGNRIGVVRHNGLGPTDNRQRNFAGDVVGIESAARARIDASDFAKHCHYVRFFGPCEASSGHDESMSKG